jgi:hypothetical protein
MQLRHVRLKTSNVEFSVNVAFYWVRFLSLMVSIHSGIHLVALGADSSLF